MSYSLGTAAPSTGHFTAPNSGIQGIIIGNQSGQILSVTMEGGAVSKTLYAGTADFFPKLYGFSGQILWTTTSAQNSRNLPGASITFDAVGLTEKFDSSTYPISLAATQAVTATATGKPIFSATVGFGSTATNNQILNIFNPANSGVVATFHSGRVFTNDSTGPTANLQFLYGADVNLATPVSAISHSDTSNPPVSVMHCTALDGIPPSSNATPEVMNMQQNVTQDFLAFPDAEILFPGNNLYINLSAGSTGHVVRLTLKWTEDTVVPPTLVTGATAVASQVDSELFAVGTNLIKSVVPGPLTPVQLFNDGTGFYSVDQSGTLHRVFTFNSAGNPLQLGQAGDILETLGQLTVDQLLTALAGFTASGGAINITGNALNSLHIGQLTSGDILDTNSGDTFLKSPNIIQFQIPSGTNIAQIVPGGITLQSGKISLLAGSISRLWISGALAIAVAGTSVSHGLGAVPDFVAGILDEGAAGTGVIGVNFGTMTSTTFTALCTPASTCRFIAIKQ